MLKKVIPIILSLCVAFSISAAAQEVTKENIPEVAQSAGDRKDMGMPQMPEMDMGNMPQGMPNGEMMPSGMNREGMQGGMRGMPGNMQNNSSTAQTEQETGLLGFVKTYSTPITSLILLAIAYVFVIFYKRKNY